MNGEESYKLKKKILWVCRLYRQKKRKKRITASLLELASHFDTNTKPMVRRSDSGGWHGLYSEHEFQSAIPGRDNSNNTIECNELDSPSCSGSESDSPRGVITVYFQESDVSNLPPAKREVDQELQTQTSDSSNKVISTRLKRKGSKGDGSEPMYPPLDSIDVPSNCMKECYKTEVELQNETKDPVDLTIKRVELLYDESIRLQNALVKLSHMTGNLHRILKSSGVLAQDSLSTVSVDNRGQSVVSGSSHYLPFSLSQDILETETPFETPSCTDFSVMLAQAIDKHSEDTLRPSGEQQLTSRDPANLNAIAEQDSIIQLEKELQEENKRLKTSLIDLSCAMSALHRAIVDSRREPKRNHRINEKLSVKPAMIEATISNDHTTCNKKTSGNLSPKLMPVDCESVDDDELGLGFNDPLLSPPVKNKIKVDDATSKVGPEHFANKITTTPKKEKLKKKKKKKRKSQPDNYTETLTNDNVDQKNDASMTEMIQTNYRRNKRVKHILELSDQKDNEVIEYKTTNATKAIIVLQSMWRMMSQRKKYVSYMKNIVVFWRKELENMASLLIQTNYRRPKMVQSILHLSAAVIICQSVVRRFLALKRISRHLRDVKNATLLQSTWRRHLAVTKAKTHKSGQQSAANSKDDCASTNQKLDTMLVVVDTMLVVTINKHRDDILHLLNLNSRNVDSTVPSYLSARRNSNLMAARRNSNLRALAAANQLVYRSGGQKLLPNDLKRLLAKAEEDAVKLHDQLKFQAAPALW